MNEQDKAIVRNFLASTAGQHWLQEARDNCPELDIMKVSADIYNIGLYEARGWDRCIRWQKSSVGHVPVQEYGLVSIDTTID